MTFEYTSGLEKILKRERIFLLDTNVILSHPSGVMLISDEAIQLAAQLTNRNQKIDRMYAVYNVIRQHDNVRFTPEVYNEILSKFGDIATVCQRNKNKNKLKLVEEANKYFRRNVGELLIDDKIWTKGEMAPIGLILDKEFKKINPDFKPLSKADLSLLLKSLGFLLAEDYSRVDLIACDYGIVKGAKAMFSIIEQLPVGSDKAKRRIKYRCMKIISREFEENYHDEFDSSEYFKSLQNT